MAKREDSKSYERNRIEVQKGPISMDEQYSNNFRRQPECTLRDLEDNRMRQEKMTLTLHTPEQ
jgi:hypothetical protein